MCVRSYKCTFLCISALLSFFVLRSHASFVFCGLYAAFVFAGQHLMRARPKLNLRRPLALWSLSLAAFRWVGNALFTNIRINGEG